MLSTPPRTPESNVPVSPVAVPGAPIRPPPRRRHPKPIHPDGELESPVIVVGSKRQHDDGEKEVLRSQLMAARVQNANLLEMNAALQMELDATRAECARSRSDLVAVVAEVRNELATGYKDAQLAANRAVRLAEIHDKKEQEIQCGAVCGHVMGPNERYLLLQCGHPIHGECMASLANEGDHKFLCPLCRAPIEKVVPHDLPSLSNAVMELTWGEITAADMQANERCQQWLSANDEYQEPEPSQNLDRFG